MPTECNFKSIDRYDIVILIGDCRVGKTSYLNYVVNNHTIGKGKTVPPTIGV
jgi:GTP-binding protein EngB required for normal cell division